MGKGNFYTAALQTSGRTAKVTDRVDKKKWRKVRANNWTWEAIHEKNRRSKKILKTLSTKFRRLKASIVNGIC